MNQQRIVHAAVLSRRFSKPRAQQQQQHASSPGFTAATTQPPSLNITNNSWNDKNDNNSEPFYGRPRQSFSFNNPYSSSSSTTTTAGRFATTIPDRIAVAIHSATTAFADPTRADAVAALGDITAPRTLQRIHQQMMQDPTGRQILKERPIVSKATIPYQRLMDEAPDYIPNPDDSNSNNNNNDTNLTFGQAYGCFLKSHGFDPDERDDVNYVQDEELAYIMKRYRQCHDFWHALTGLPPTVLGELGIKWLELFQTGLPVAALSCTVGSLRLNARERDVLMTQYLPWAWRASQSTDSSFLMNVYYEKEFDTPLQDLRSRLNLEAAPSVRL
ncbi:coenzyme Q ubiquinone biosynthesis protein Coq4 [Nitzschia inconspicua]|uniref:Ubiquinone biosynthesis protein COQ4 homolog, mitochondrial n=1 Tax=Nitzschia inconspicua TaxID=303405 RepID=A0A9K3KN92_9STRA|nr:coenzyme Q ubiquinone biosynthesis protein Coq4 [Nitzschia inconspicua]